MTNWILLASQAAAGCVRTAVCLLLLFRLFPLGRPEKKNIITALAGAAALSVFLSLTGFPRQNLYFRGAEALWIVFCAVRLQSADARMSLFVSICYEIAVALWQFLSASWLCILLQTPAFLADETGRGQLVIWLVHGLLTAFALYLSRQHEEKPADTFRLISLPVLAGFLAVILLSGQTVPGLPPDTLDTWIILAVILLLSVLVFYTRRQYETEKELARLKSEQADLLERDYTALNAVYTANAKLFHDLHNHIGVLQQLLSHKKTEQALQYLQELQTPVQEMTAAVWTGDETIDYLINSKAARAKADRIDMQAHVEFPRHTDIQSADLCAILGNLLDNALEAAGKVPEPEKRLIRLTIRRINQLLIIKVENTFAAPLIEKEGALQTTKADKGLHGWGLKSARTAAEKYNGCLQTSGTDNLFRAVATLSYQGVSIKS